MFIYLPYSIICAQVVSNEKLSTHLCYNVLMDLSNIQQVVIALRQRLEPVERANQLRDTLEGQRPNARQAAVLIGLFEQEGEATLIFIRRASTLRSHSGEIAFPGGSVDATDESPVQAALREAQEEIGLHPGRAEILGIMQPVFTVVSNFLITPVVAYLAQGPGELRLQASEVADLLLLPLRGLADPAIAHTEVWRRDGLARPVYFYDYGVYRVLGATARMLNALL